MNSWPSGASSLRYLQPRGPFGDTIFRCEAWVSYCCRCLMLPLGQRSSEDPLQHLPSNIEVLTHFGERADISPDNQRVAFMAKSFGDAMVIDLKSRVIQCLTCNVPGAAFPSRDASGDRRLHPDRSRPLRKRPHQPHSRQRTLVSRQGTRDPSR